MFLQFGLGVELLGTEGTPDIRSSPGTVLDMSLPLSLVDVLDATYGTFVDDIGDDGQVRWRMHGIHMVGKVHLGVELQRTLGALDVGEKMRH